MKGAGYGLNGKLYVIIYLDFRSKDLSIGRQAAGMTTHLSGLKTITILTMKELLISQDENGEWFVTNEKIPGFIARGKTQSEAIDKMKQALSVYFPCGDCKESE
jgi:hypothetical protein